MQNPQWVQVRSTFSDCRDIGVGELLGREIGPHQLQNSLDHSPRIEDPAGIKAILDPSGERGERRRLRLEHRDGTAQRRRPPDQGGMARAAPVLSADRVADHRGAPVLGSWQLQPKSARRPNRDTTGIEPPGDRLAELGAAAWCDRDAPDGVRSPGRDERHDVANRSPESTGRFVFERLPFTIRCQFGQQLLTAEGDGGKWTLETKCRDDWTIRRAKPTGSQR